MVYVDDLKTHRKTAIQPSARRWGNQWCHMTADTVDELHAMALAIGLKPEWFQKHDDHPHYDLRPPTRILAINAGAVYKSARDQAVERRAKKKRLSIREDETCHRAKP